MLRLGQLERLDALHLHQVLRLLRHALLLHLTLPHQILYRRDLLRARLSERDRLVNPVRYLVRLVLLLEFQNRVLNRMTSFYALVREGVVRIVVGGRARRRAVLQVVRLEAGYEVLDFERSRLRPRLRVVPVYRYGRSVSQSTRRRILQEENQLKRLIAGNGAEHRSGFRGEFVNWKVARHTEKKGEIAETVRTFWVRVARISPKETGMPLPLRAPDFLNKTKSFVPFLLSQFLRYLFSRNLSAVSFPKAKVGTILPKS